MTSAATRVSLRSEAFASVRGFFEKRRAAVRVASYFYVILVACPVRYWPVSNNTVDDTWVFALNYAAARGLAAGRDFIYNTGPLAYLTLPQNIGGNLLHGLIFQFSLWLLLAVLFAALFFRGGFAVRNLAVFSFCFGLSAPLYAFNSVGVENLLLAGGLVLTLIYHRNGSLWAYVTALILIGLAPLIKLSAGFIGFSAVVCFAADRIIQRRWKALPEAALTALIPPAVFTVVGLAVLPSAGAFVKFLRGSAEIIRGYGAAMAMNGPHIELVAAAEAAAVLLAVLWLQARDDAKTARFYIALLALPLFVSFKHGFIRQDIHIINFFCFVALALGLVSLTIQFRSRSGRGVIIGLLIFFLIWQDNVIRQLGIRQQAGAQSLRMLSGLFPLTRLRQRLDSAFETLAVNSPIEPEIRIQIGHSAVASLSPSYTTVAAAGLNLVLYPTLQQFEAYTPYLDQLNATWIRDSGPAFLLFDGTSIDDRNVWAETPAAWSEVYRWYDTRRLARHNLLLQRRLKPRFTAFKAVGALRSSLSGEIRLPRVQQPLFWTMKCGYNPLGRLQSLLFRIPHVFMSVHDSTGIEHISLIIPEMLTSPVLGNYLPRTLPQFAALLQPGWMPDYAVNRLSFSGSGGAFYSGNCEVELFQPAL